MKSYEETARDALQRIEVICTKRRCRRRNIIRTTIAMGCVALTVFCSTQLSLLTPNVSDGLPTETDAPHTSALQKPTSETDTRIVTSVLQMAYLSNNGWDSCDMEKQIEIPMRYRLSVVDVRGLTAAQRDALREEKVEQLLHQELNEYYEGYNDGGGFVNNAWDNAMFILLRGGSFQLDVEEQKTVASLSAECGSIYGEVELAVHSGNLVGEKVTYQAKNYDGIERVMEQDTRNGNAYLHGMGITMDGAIYHRIQSDGAMYIYWKPSSKMYETLNEAPTKRLSEFTDRMTITVSYTDGTCESHLLDIVFHDDGSIGAIYQGVTQSEQ